MIRILLGLQESARAEFTVRKATIWVEATKCSGFE